MDWKYKPLADSFKAFRARKPRMMQYLEDKEIADAGKKATKIKIAIRP